MFDFFETPEGVIMLISGLALVVLAVTSFTKSKKDDEYAKKIINLLEKLSGRDLDKDGDVGE